MASLTHRDKHTSLSLQSNAALEELVDGVSQVFGVNDPFTLAYDLVKASFISFFL